MITVDGSYITSKLYNGYKKSATCRFELFDSYEEKYLKLFNECTSKQIRGTSAHELLTFGGSAHIMWIDIDTHDWDAFNAWRLSDTFPIQEDSYVAIPSSMGKVHVYVRTDRPLLNEECIGMYTTLIESMTDTSLAMDLDRVYGPMIPMHIYIPGAAQGIPCLPQDLVKDLPGVHHLGNELGNVPISRWRNEKALVRAATLDRLL